MLNIWQFWNKTDLFSQWSEKQLARQKQTNKISQHKLFSVIMKLRAKMNHQMINELVLPLMMYIIFSSVWFAIFMVFGFETVTSFIWRIYYVPIYYISFDVQVLAEAIYMSCQSKACINVLSVSSAFCHAIVKKPTSFQGLSFLLKGFDEELFEEQRS